eukprot:ANDGO_06832.mRNA.1 Gastrulation defective protein 1 homolog
MSSNDNDDVMAMFGFGSFGGAQPAAPKPKPAKPIQLAQSVAPQLQSEQTIENTRGRLPEMRASSLGAEKFHESVATNTRNMGRAEPLPQFTARRPTPELDAAFAFAPATDIVSHSLDPSCNRLALASKQGLFFADLHASFSSFRTVKYSSEFPSRAVWSPDGRALAVLLSGDPTFRILNRESKCFAMSVRGDQYLVDVSRTKGHTAQVVDAVWATTDDVLARRPQVGEHHGLAGSLATVAEDGTLRVWEVSWKNDGLVQKYVGKSPAPRTACSCVCWIPGTSHILVGRGTLVHLHDTANSASLPPVVFSMDAEVRGIKPLGDDGRHFVVLVDSGIVVVDSKEKNPSTFRFVDLCSTSTKRTVPCSHFDVYGSTVFVSLGSHVVQFDLADNAEHIDQCLEKPLFDCPDQSAVTCLSYHALIHQLMVSTRSGCHLLYNSRGGSQGGVLKYRAAAAQEADPAVYISRPRSALEGFSVAVLAAERRKIAKQPKPGPIPGVGTKGSGGQLGHNQHHALLKMAGFVRLRDGQDGEDGESVEDGPPPSKHPKPPV